MPVLLALLAYVALEIWVLVLVGQAVGFLGLLGLLVASALVGAWALKREGRRSVADLGRAVRSGRPAEAEVAGGMYLALAGVLLVVPGLLSTLAALVLLVPPVRRALARRAAARAVRAGSARMGPSITVVGAGAPGGYGPRGPAGPRDPWHGRVIEGHVIDAPAPDDDRPDGEGPGRARHGG
ncbi:FxsA family protein [Actinomycetospora sp. TBRC 11914]|uniref:FxsA family protein n=1 Tax=Actinomycetospora sp. TBRC 11914 TaxID=2729387 RepID=UPI001B7D5AEE|nr:FxsA family protein [Actinomycetospora sp. TBRC 11914]